MPAKDISDRGAVQFSEIRLNFCSLMWAGDRLLVEQQNNQFTVLKQENSSLFHDPPSIPTFERTSQLGWINDSEMATFIISPKARNNRLSPSFVLSQAKNEYALQHVKLL